MTRIGRTLLLLLIFNVLAVTMVCADQACQSSTASKIEGQQENLDKTVDAERQTTCAEKQDKLYKNSRFGYSIAYPNEFIATMYPANGDGIRLESPDKQATLIMAGGNNYQGAINDMYSLDVKNVQGKILTNVYGDYWYELSWEQGDQIFYKKVFVGDGSHNSMVFSYQKQQEAKYKDVSKKLESTFQPGDINKSW